MLIETIRDFYDYTDWANDRVLTAAEGLTIEQFLMSDLPGIYPIRDSLAHIMLAEVTWLDRWPFDSNLIDREESEFPDLASIRAYWAEVNVELQAFLNDLDDEKLAQDFTYINHLGDTYTFRLGDTLLHVANHSTYHRGEVAALLTRYGCSPGELDITRWLVWKSKQ